MASSTAQPWLQDPACCSLVGIYCGVKHMLSLCIHAPTDAEAVLHGLGTSRLQLHAKGDDGIYGNITSVVLACGGIFIPASRRSLTSARMQRYPHTADGCRVYRLALCILQGRLPRFCATLQATHWLVDRCRYGVTLAAVNILGVLCCVFQVRTSSQRPYCCRGLPTP